MITGPIYRRQFPAHHSRQALPEVEAKVKELAIRAFQAIDCMGMARLTFCASRRSILVNEINTIPGFTRISMYPKMWEASGIGFSSLLDRLIELALEHHRRRADPPCSMKRHDPTPLPGGSTPLP